MVRACSSCSGQPKKSDCPRNMRLMRTLAGCLVGTIAGLDSAAGVGQPTVSGAEIARSANVVWRDALWADDGSGALPIGNGDVASPVWVESTTGDLRVVLRKSDTFDENSQPVTTGVLRFAFSPPLWEVPANCNAGVGDKLNSYSNATKDGASTIGSQDHIILTDKTHTCTSAETCAEEMAEVCCATPGCAAFSINMMQAAQPMPQHEVVSAREEHVLAADESPAAQVSRTGSAPPWSCRLFNCTCQGMSDYYGVIAGSGFGCTTPEAQDWWKAHGCGTKAKSGKDCVGPACSLPGHAPCVPAPQPAPPPIRPMLELFSSTKLDPGPVGAGWNTFVNKKPVAPAPPAPPPGAAAACSATERFCMELDIATATVNIVTPSVRVKAWVDLNAPLRNGKSDRSAGVLHVQAKAAGTDLSGFGLTVTLEPFRTEGVSPLGAANCETRYQHPDTIVAANDDTLTWYHWNHINSSYANDTMRSQGMDPASTPGDPFTHRAFGARVMGAGLKTKNSTVLTGDGLSEIDVTATLLTLPPHQAPTESSWLDAIRTVEPSGGSSGAACTAPFSRACVNSWEELTERSYIQVTPTKADSNDTLAKMITDHVPAPYNIYPIYT